MCGLFFVGCLLLNLFVAGASSSDFAHTPCNITNSNPEPYSELKDKWPTLFVDGFCDSLFGKSKQQILPLSSISCLGEAGSFGFVRSLLGATTESCRSLIATTICRLAFPGTEPNTNTPILPCSPSQTTTFDSSSQTLEALIRHECATLAPIFLASEIGSKVSVVDAALDASSQSGKNLRENCVAANLSWIPTKWQCPSQLVKLHPRDMEHSPAACAIPCPAPLYQPEVSKLLPILQRVLNLLSLCVIGLAIMSWLFVEKRSFEFPASLQLNLMVCVGCVHGLMWVSVEMNNQLLCRNAYTAATQHYTPCGIQGALLLYFAKSAAIWWFATIVVLFLTLVYRSRVTKWMIFRRVVYVVGWGWPVVAPVVALAAHLIDRSQASPWCFLTNSNSGLYEWMLFYIEEGSLLVLGVLLGSIVIVHIIRVDLNVRSARKNNRGMPGAVFKLPVLMGIVLWQLLALLLWRLYFATKSDQIHTQATAWFISQFLPASSASQPTTTLANALDLNPWYVILAVVTNGISGTVIGLVSLLGKPSRDSWVDLCGGARDDDDQLPPQLPNFQKMSQTPPNDPPPPRRGSRVEEAGL